MAFTPKFSTKNFSPTNFHNNFLSIFFLPVFSQPAFRSFAQFTWSSLKHELNLTICQSKVDISTSRHNNNRKFYHFTIGNQTRLEEQIIGLLVFLSHQNYKQYLAVIIRQNANKKVFLKNKNIFFPTASLVVRHCCCRSACPALDP